MGATQTKAPKVSTTKRYTHVRYGYTVLTNLSEADLELYFNSDEALRGWFKRIGIWVGDDVPDTMPKRPAPLNAHPTTLRILRRADTAWHAEALCRTEVASDVDFTPAIEVIKVRYALMDPESDQVRNMRAAQEVCASCPVSTACLSRSVSDRGMSGVGETGIWAGTVELHRRDLLILRRSGLKRGLVTLRSRISTLDRDVLVCSRCWRLTNDKGGHRNRRFDASCPGAITTIRLGDLVRATWPNVEAELSAVES